jgi:drug/metabolite transporter (DMT)-like permease
MRRDFPGQRGSFATLPQLFRIVMPLAALLLVVIAAFAHASWNMLAKHAAFCRHFNLFYSAGSVLLYAPLATWLLLYQRPVFSGAVVAMFFATGLLHVGYSDVLQRGYRAADMSVVYPVARGSGPLLAFCGAILVLKERPSLLALAGALLVVAGVLVIAGGRAVLKKAATRTGLVWGMVIGCAIASYTLVDGYAVKVLLIAPPLVDYAGNLFRLVVLTPRALMDRPRLVNEFKQYWRQAWGVAVLGPLAYILVLYAMTLAPVSHVAPARELSMMVGTYFGARVFQEEARRSRFIAAGLMVLGVVALTIG